MCQGPSPTKKNKGRAESSARKEKGKGKAEGEGFSPAGSPIKKSPKKDKGKGVKPSRKIISSAGGAVPARANDIADGPSTYLIVKATIDRIDGGNVSLKRLCREAEASASGTGPCEIFAHLNVSGREISEVDVDKARQEIQEMCKAIEAELVLYLIKKKSLMKKNN